MNYRDDIRTLEAQRLTRRWFLRDCGVGLAGIALNSLLTREGRAAPAP